MIQLLIELLQFQTYRYIQLQGQSLLIGDGGSIGSSSANNSINIGADGIVTFNNGVSGIAVASSVLLDATDGSNSDEGDNIVQNTAADENTNINYENATDDVFLYRYIDIERDGQLEKHSRMLHERTTQDRMITLILEDATEKMTKVERYFMKMPQVIYRWKQSFHLQSSQMWIRNQLLLQNKVMVELI